MSKTREATFTVVAIAPISCECRINSPVHPHGCDRMPAFECVRCHAHVCDQCWNHYAGCCFGCLGVDE